MAAELRQALKESGKGGVGPLLPPSPKTSFYLQALAQFSAFCLSHAEAEQALGTSSKLTHLSQVLVVNPFELCRFGIRVNVKEERGHWGHLSGASIYF